MSKWTRVITVVIILCVLAVPGARLFKGNEVKGKYEELQQRYQSRSFNYEPMSDEVRESMMEIRQTWVAVVKEEMPEEVCDTLRFLGYEADVQGLVDFWSAEMPEYSRSDQASNQRWAVHSQLREALTPVDQKYYHGDRVLFVRDEDKMAAIYRDTGDGIRMTMYAPELPEDLKQEVGE